MKKLMVFIMAAFMAVSFAGTATAVDYVVNLDSPTRVYASPVASGNTVYVLTTSLPGSSGTGTTLWQINPASGASSAFRGAFNPLGSTSAFGTPVLFEGTSGVTLVMNVYTGVSVAAAERDTILTGTSLFAVFFNSANSANTQWVRDLNIKSGLGYNNIGGAGYWPAYDSGATVGYTNHLAIDTESTGTTIYGVSGVSVIAGASVWAIPLNSGVTNNNWFSGGLNQVSTYYTAPVISGNSLFLLGTYGNPVTSGTSLLMFDKRKLNAGPTNIAPVLGAPGVKIGSGATPFATPAVAGNSIFVVDGTGGLTAYSIHKDNLLGFTRATDFRQLSGSNVAGVTAGPVTNGTFLAVAANYPAIGRAGVSVFDIRRQLNASTGSSWWFEWSGGANIIATPAISNGYLYVIVDRVGGTAEVHRFLLNQGNIGGTAVSSRNWTVDKNGVALGWAEYASPIISGNRLIYVSDQTNRLYSLDISDTAGSTDSWVQFKANAARTGENTSTPAAAAVAAGDDDSGCFISTIK